MHRNYLHFLLTLGILLFLSSLSAQPWVDYFEKGPDANFFETKRLFEEHWRGRPIERGKGYKQFKRWEHFWESRVFPDGSFPAANTNEAAIEEYLASQPGAAASSAGSWTPMGPVTSTGGYAGIGRINCIGFHPTDVNTIYVGSAGGGFWRTADGGSSWTNLTDNLISVLGVSGIVVEPNDPNIIYIATGDGDARDNPSVGVMKSTDGGLTWNTTGLNWAESSGRVIRRLIRHASNANILLAASNVGIYRTTDAGATWTLALSGSFYDAEFMPGSTGTFYAATATAIYRSTDNGATWSSVFSSSTSNRIAIAVSPANPQLVAALCSKSADSGFNGFYASVDGGTSFTLKSSTPNILGYNVNGSDAGGQGWYDLCVAVSPTDANTILIGGVNTWRSTNGGSTWSIMTMWYDDPTAVQPVHADKHDIVYQNSSTLFQANDGGIYKSTNGGSFWTDISNGLVISQLYRLGVAQTSSAVITGLQDNGTKYLSSAGVWTDEIGGDGMECAIDPTNASVMYGELYYGDMRRSTDGGLSWYNIKPTNDQGDWITPFALDPANPQTIYLGFRDVYKSTNRGTNWTKVSNAITGNATTGPYLRAIAIAPSATGTIYASANADLATGSRLYRSTDGGTTWLTLTNPTNVGRITYLGVHSGDPNTVFATISGYSAGQKVFRSTNGGSSWTNISGTLPNLPANCVIYQKDSDGALYLAMDVGVYYRDNTMTDWVLFSQGLPNVEVTELEIQYGLGKIRAATYGRGLWESDLYSASPPPVCNAPASSEISSSNITASGARLSCSVAGASGYDWRYRQAGAAAWTDLPSTSVNYTDLSGLAGSTQYEYQVAVQCTSVWSAFSPSGSFTTLTPPCNAPATTQISASNITSAAARLNCSVTGVSAYDWRYRPAGTLTWIDMGTTTANFTDLSGLTANTQYEYQVAVQCGSTWSAFSASNTFTTSTNVCNAPGTTQIFANAIASNKATLNCSVSGVSAYDWRYRRAGTTTWTDVALTTTNYRTITKLSASTAYEFQVSVQCGGLWSAWSASGTFTTPAKGGTPQGTPQGNPQVTSGEIRVSPVPASGYAWVDFTLDEQSEVRIRIIDLNGKMVRALNRGVLDAGQHQEQIDLSALPVGMYFLRLESRDYDKTVRIVVQ